MKVGLILCKCFITYPNSVSVLISFVFSSWFINEFDIYISIITPTIHPSFSFSSILSSILSFPQSFPQSFPFFSFPQFFPFLNPFLSFPQSFPQSFHFLNPFFNPFLNPFLSSILPFPSLSFQIISLPSMNTYLFSLATSLQAIQLNLDLENFQQVQTDWGLLLKAQFHHLDSRELSTSHYQ